MVEKTLCTQFTNKANFMSDIDKDFLERRKTATFSEELIEEIAEKAATKAISKMEDKIYTLVGKSVLSKIFYITGAITVGVYLWLQTKGIVK